MTDSLKKKSNLKAMIALALAGLATAAVVAVSTIPQAEAVVDRRAMGATTQENGFPNWYQDASGQGMRVAPCLDAALCGFEPGDDPTNPAEVIYFSGESSMPVGNGSARLVMAVEGAYANDVVADGEQVTAAVTVLRAKGLKPGASYKVTYPYGVINTTADAKGSIRVIREAGCDPEAAGAVCDFSLPLKSVLFNGFLKWNPDVAPAAPAGFLGNPNRVHSVVGSPQGTNYFKIEGPAAGGPGDNIQVERKFLITGQLAQ